ncbi:NIL domain-containing protein [Nostocaceae cyanobacterium CENA357]|uniref:NIL domain-containing protein n=1 Tax=Atlanticothrix silvestris CENA357 TaxID=1725252 RepID=A0A8J7HFL4_9CYAN|nr:NIL domain-containing protein [Atlanticothrix silvestris]MBH8551403.1 NIL domain-containing protein [Atlanticothrix silvestris CENA357]
MPQQKLPQLTPIDSRIRIPQHYQRQPLISRLVSRYGVTVNITAAMLTATENYGWFDLQLQGNSEHICNGLLYLQNLGVDLMQLSIPGNVQHNLSFQPFPHPSKEFVPLPTQEQTQPYQGYSSQSYRLRLQICILKDYYQTPIISDLVSRYGVTVNIIGASLLANQEDDGWFDLDLWGKTQQLFSSFNYLKTLNLPMWVDESSLDGHLI